MRVTMTHAVEMRLPISTLPPDLLNGSTVLVYTPYDSKRYYLAQFNVPQREWRAGTRTISPTHFIPLLF